MGQGRLPRWIFPAMLLPLGAMGHLFGWGAALLLLIWQGVISAVTLFIYMSDKQRAQQGEWRVPETKLHLLEAVGGWPGAALAQQLFRHKTQKSSYQLIFRGIVLAWQVAAIDALRHGPVYQKLAPWVEEILGR